MIDLSGHLSELHVVDDYWPPELGRIYLVNRDVFGRSDEKPRRPYVVIGLDDDNGLDLAVVRRSTSAGHGVVHDAHPGTDIDKPGWFCEMRNAPTALWTARTVSDTEVDLTEIELAYVMGTFL